MASEYTITIMRHASTAQYESVEVKISETIELEDDEVDGEYKRLSAKVEKYIGHEIRKYRADPDSKKVR